MKNKYFYLRKISISQSESFDLLSIYHHDHEIFPQFQWLYHLFIMSNLLLSLYTVSSGRGLTALQCFTSNNNVTASLNSFKPEFTSAIFIHYKLRMAVAIVNL